MQRYPWHSTRNPLLPDYDTLIIGSGAGGATLARSLADSGESILILERGDRLPQEDDNWSADAVVAEGKYQTDEEWEDAVEGDRFSPQAYYRVGGNTKVYGGLLQRMRERDFTDLANTPTETAPAGRSATTRSSPSTPKPNATTRSTATTPMTRPPPDGAAPTPSVPFAHEPRIQEIADRLEGKGLHPFYSSLCLDRGASRKGSDRG